MAQSRLLGCGRLCPGSLVCLNHHGKNGKHEGWSDQSGHACDFQASSSSPKQFQGYAGKELGWWIGKPAQENHD